MRISQCSTHGSHHSYSDWYDLTVLLQDEKAQRNKLAAKSNDDDGNFVNFIHASLVDLETLKC